MSFFCHFKSLDYQIFFWLSDFINPDFYQFCFSCCRPSLIPLTVILDPSLTKPSSWQVDCTFICLKSDFYCSALPLCPFTVWDASSTPRVKLRNELAQLAFSAPIPERTCPTVWGTRAGNIGIKEGPELEGTPSHSWVTVAEIAVPLKEAQGQGLRQVYGPPVVRAERKNENENGGLKP